MRSVKEAIKFWSSEYDNLKEYIDARYSDFQSLVQSLYQYIQEFNSELTVLQKTVTNLNSRLTQDVLESIENFGTIQDFENGLYDGFGDKR